MECQLEVTDLIAEITSVTSSTDVQVSVHEKVSGNQNVKTTKMMNFNYQKSLHLHQ